MLHTNVEAFFPDLTEEINLFPGADNFEITHFMCEKDGFLFFNVAKSVQN